MKGNCMDLLGPAILSFCGPRLRAFARHKACLTAYGTRVLPGASPCFVLLMVRIRALEKLSIRVSNACLNE